jgi:hypothetical protein
MTIDLLPISYTKFLEITTDHVLLWKNHRDQCLPKPGAACYPIKSSKSITTQETSMMVLYAYFHLIMHYGIILWGNSPYYTTTFELQNKVLPVLGINDSCIALIKTLNIIPHQSQHIFLLLCFAVMNMGQNKVNSDIHGKDTKHSSHLHQLTSVTLSKRYLLHRYLRFLSLRFYTTDLSHNIKQFKLILRDYSNSFYTLEEYFNYNSI